MVQLVLWDIEHTLVTTRGIDAQLFGRAFRETTGKDMKQLTRSEGATDAAAFLETAKLHEAPADRADFERFAAALTQRFRLQAPAIHERGLVMPGAPAALSGINSLSGVAQTVVTDNVRGAAEVKLRMFGMHSQIDWSIGAFADDADDHEALVPLALQRASAALGREVPPSQVVYIGDAPGDVRAALAAGVRPLAVASGRSDAAALRAAGATEVLAGLDETEELLKRLA